MKYLYLSVSFLLLSLNLLAQSYTFSPNSFSNYECGTEIKMRVKSLSGSNITFQIRGVNQNNPNSCFTATNFGSSGTVYIFLMSNATQTPSTYDTPIGSVSYIQNTPYVNIPISLSNLTGTGYYRAAIYKPSCGGYGYCSTDPVAVTSTTPPTGNLKVNIYPPAANSFGAKWRITNGNWRNSGYTETGLTAGSYTVEFKSVSGWNQPSNKTITVLSNQTKTVGYSYNQSTISAPTNLQATAVGTSQVQLTWNSVSGVSFYRVFNANTGLHITTINHQTNNTQLLVPSLAAGQNHCFYVKAVDASNSPSVVVSSASNTDCVNITAIPTNPTVTLTSPNSGTFQTGTTINITWNSTNQHHYGVFLTKGSSNQEVGTIFHSGNTNSAQNISWTVPTTISYQGTPHTIAGNDYKIKIVVWDSNNQATAQVTFDFSNSYLTITPPTANCVYTDLITNNLTWASTAATYLCNNSIINYANGDSKGIDPVNRAEMAKMTALSIGLDGSGANTNFYPSPYMDLQDANQWYYGHAKNLLYLDFGDGISPFSRDKANFYPANELTRAEALKVILEAWDVDIISGTTPYSDDNSHHLKDYIYTARNKGIISATQANNMFRPDDAAIRAEIFQMLYNIMTHPTINSPTINTNSFFKVGNYTPQNLNRRASIAEGNFNTYTKSSFYIPGINLPLTFEHSYNSYLTELPDELFGMRPLGKGWTHTYNSYIMEIDGGGINQNIDKLAIMWANSAIHIYNKNSNGTYTNQSNGVYDQFTKNGNQITITTKSQIQYVFEKLSGAYSTTPYVLTSIKDRNNNIITLNYDYVQNGQYRLKNIQGTAGRYLTFQYNSNSSLVKSISDPMGRVVRFYYNQGYSGQIKEAQSDLTAFEDAENHTTDYEYFTTSGLENLLKEITLPENNKITNQYDYNRKLQSSQNSMTGSALSVNTSPVYSSANTSVNATVTNIIAGVTRNSSYSMNKDGMVESYTNASGQTASMNFPTSGQVTKPNSITGIDGVSYSITYDNMGNIKQISMPYSIVHKFDYNGFNDIIKYTNPLNKATEYTYTNGNLTKIKTPMGFQTNINRYPNGLINTVTNPNNITVTYSYDQYGNVIKIQAPMGIKTQYSHDIIGRVETTTNALGHTVTNDYDNNDNLIQIVDAKSFITLFGFDDNDNLTTITNAENAVTTLGYNDLDLLESESFQGKTTGYTYYPNGLLKTRATPNGYTFNYAYDKDNKLTNDGYSIYTYYTNGRIKTVTRNGKTILYNYDAIGRVSSIVYDGVTVGYVYDKNSNIIQLQYPNNKVVIYTYDDDNRLKTVKDWNTQITTYNYRSDGLLDKEIFPNGIETIYSYDAAGRLVGQQTKDGSTILINQTFVPNPLGNHTTETKTTVFSPTIVIPSETIIPTYNGKTNRITQYGTKSFTYDDNGNTLTKTGYNFTYDIADMLTNISGNLNLTNEYDGLGNRRKATRNGTTTKYVLDIMGMSKVLLETDNSGNAQNYFVYGLGLISRIKPNGTTHYYHYDFRGSTLAMTDASANTTHFYAYDEFGNILDAQEQDFNAFRYVGKYGVMYEGDSLYFMRARFYDSEIGRFLSEDPIWSVNLYVYTENSPINNSDPLGLYTVQHGFGFSAGYMLSAKGEIGLAISYDDDGNSRYGIYLTGEFGAGAGGGAGFSHSASTQNSIDDLKGTSTVIGVSSPFGGTEVGINMGDKKGTNVVLQAPATKLEGYIRVSKTKVYEVKDPRKFALLLGGPIGRAMFIDYLIKSNQK
jgi:RHS repeat-associated protein